jgi:hypothetical protein
MQVVFGQPTAHMDHAVHDLRTNELTLSNPVLESCCDRMAALGYDNSLHQTDLKY